MAGIVETKFTTPTTPVAKSETEFPSSPIFWNICGA